MIYDYKCHYDGICTNDDSDDNGDDDNGDDDNGDDDGYDYDYDYGRSL